MPERKEERAYISTEHLAVGYGGHALIREIGIHVRRGEIVTLIGPNGSGKSRILKAVIGQLPELSGAGDLAG